MLLNGLYDKIVVFKIIIINVFSFKTIFFYIYVWQKYCLFLMVICNFLFFNFNVDHTSRIKELKITLNFTFQFNNLTCSV